LTSGRIIALLMAAGRGSRFDPSGEQDKLLALVDSIPVVVRAAASVSDCDHCVAVIAPDKPQLLQALSQTRCERITAADAGLGMGHSIAAGARHVARMPDVAAVLIMLGDMPDLQRNTVRRLIECFKSQAAGTLPEPLRIIAPRYQGQRGHPVIFGAAHLPALCSLRGDQGAASLLRSLPIETIAVDDAGTIRDIDTREDLTVAGGGLDRRQQTPSWHKP
jgi:molybdenum cofactor cytidylyltransferase